MKKSLFVITVLLLLLPLLSAAQTTVEPARTLRFKVYFGHGVGGSVLSSDMFPLADSLFHDPAVKVLSVSVKGWASPDGNAVQNIMVSKARADSVVARMYNLGLSRNVPVFAEGAGEQWEPVVSSMDTISADAVSAHLPSLRSLMAERNFDRREWLLRQVGEGRPWTIIREASYDACRYADVAVSYYVLSEQDDSMVEDTVPAAAVEVVAGDGVRESTFDKIMPVLDSVSYSLAPAGAPRVDVPLSNSADKFPEGVSSAGGLGDVRAPFYRCALRTNLLMPATNLGFVLHMGRHGRSSLAVDVFGPWLGEALPTGYRIDVAAAGLEYRYWFHKAVDIRDAMTGLSLGVSTRAAIWDVQWNGPGCQGEGFLAGIDLSWTARAGDCRFMFTLGGGFAFARWRPYRIYEGDEHLYRLGEWHRDLKWYGPVRVGVTLIVPMGKKNVK